MAQSGGYYEEESGGSLIGVFLIAVILLALAVVLWPVISDVLGDVETIPMTQHAEQSHRNEAVNATALVEMSASGNCWEMEIYDCPADATTKVLCKVGGNTWGGLIIGLLDDGTSEIITGYAARYSYWRKIVDEDGCTASGGSGFALP